nr:hypothetical protein BaRGS_004241 [Batillaria attramentaria]
MIYLEGLVAVYRPAKFDYLKHVHKEGNVVEVVHVPEFWDCYGPMEGPTPGRLQELRQETAQATAALRDKVTNILTAAGVQAKFEALQGKEPWETILDFARKVNATLIVIGSRDYLKHVHKEGNVVEVVHVPEFWDCYGPMEGPSPGRLRELRQETAQTTAALRDKVTNILTAAGVQAKFEALQGMEPWETVLDFARKVNATLIVIGSRAQ